MFICKYYLQSKLICESCGFNNEKPVINVKMQVVLNCPNTSLIVKIDLHIETIKKILPLNNILRNDEVFIFKFSILKLFNLTNEILI